MKDKHVILSKIRVNDLLKEAEDLLENAGRTIGATIEAIDDLENEDNQDFALKSVTRNYREILYLVDRMRADFANASEVDELLLTDDTCYE